MRDRPDVFSPGEILGTLRFERSVERLRSVSNIDIFVWEFIGVAILCLIGNGSVAAVTLKKLECDILHPDDQVELEARVLQPEEIVETLLVDRIGESASVDVLGVVVEAAVKAVVEQQRQVPLGGPRDHGVAPGRVEDEHFPLHVLGTRRARQAGKKHCRQRRGCAGPTPLTAGRLLHTH